MSPSAVTREATNEPREEQVMTEEERLRHETCIAGMIAVRGDWRTCFRGKDQQRLVSSISFGSRNKDLVEMIHGHVGKVLGRRAPGRGGYRARRRPRELRRQRPHPLRRRPPGDRVREGCDVQRSSGDRPICSGPVRSGCREWQHRQRSGARRTGRYRDPRRVFCGGSQ
jgi:hypothetical protein